MPSFVDYGLLPPILAALATERYVTPTPIQSQAIPHVIAGRDVCGIAQTGTGKTAAFALPILHRLSSHSTATPWGGCRVLALTPTRELASQIAESFCSYGRHLPLSTAAVFGGVPLGPQQRRLVCGVDILIATPGRLLDLIDRRALILSNVEILVLDEADRMLDLGFIHALRRIVKLLPRRRQTLLFSATMPRAIAALAEQYLNDPIQVTVAPSATTVERVKQGVIFVTSERKRDLLTTMLADRSFERVLVFTRTKHGADRVARHLAGAGVAAVAIHGNKSQPQRERALAGFRRGGGHVLVATDIAARGIDVDGVSHVINFELPNVPEDYVHRIGRTARAGAHGTAIAFCCDEERPYLRGIEKLTRHPIKVLPLPTAANDARDSAVGRPIVAPPHRRAAANASAAQDRPAAPIAGSKPKRTSGGNVGDGIAELTSSSLPAFLRPRASTKGEPTAHRGTRRARQRSAVR